MDIMLRAFNESIGYCIIPVEQSFGTRLNPRSSRKLSVPTEKMGVWITGFFGSGKSHFLKILGYLLENDVVAGVHAVDYFDEKIKDQLVLADIMQCDGLLISTTHAK